MTMDKSPYRRKFAKLVGASAFLAFCMLAMLSGHLVCGMELGVELVVHMLKMAIPFALCLGVIAYMAGRILDKKQVRNKKKRKKTQQLKTDDDGNIQSIFSDDGVELEDVND